MLIGEKISKTFNQIQVLKNVDIKVENGKIVSIFGKSGAVKLGYKKELEAIEDENEREELFNKLVQKMYDAGKALEAATQLEIDAVIDPADTRSIILKALETG